MAPNTVQPLYQLYTYLQCEENKRFIIIIIILLVERKKLGAKHFVTLSILFVRGIETQQKTLIKETRETAY